VLDHAFDLTVDREPQADSWIEVYSDAGGVHVIVHPAGTEIEVSATASDAEWSAVLDRVGGRTKSVDLLAGQGGSAQALVALVAQLAGLGVTDLAVGEARVTLEQRRLEIAELRDSKSDPRVRIAKAPPPQQQQGLGHTAIQQTIRLARDRVRQCYEKQLAVDSRLKGKVTASFFLEPDGTVSDVTATGMHDGVAACVADVVATLRFPKRRGMRARVTFPFVFQSA
jgi:hypothetical protein